MSLWALNQPSKVIDTAENRKGRTLGERVRPDRLFGKTGRAWQAF